MFGAGIYLFRGQLWEIAKAVLAYAGERLNQD